MAKHVKTIFVRSLPYSATNDSLRKTFSAHGKIDRCFVVGDPEKKNACRGFGEDSEAVLRQKIKMEGRLLQLEMAGRKTYSNGKLKAYENPIRKTNEKVKTLVISGLEAEQREKIERKIRKQDGFESLYEDTGRLLVQFNSKPTAAAACEKLSSLKSKGSNFSCILQVREHVIKPRYAKQCRLIVRNLSFKCTEEKLRKVFGKYGEITEVVIPRKRDQRKLGFAFVQYKKLHDAKMALERMNGQEMVGRPIAVDYTVPKDVFSNLNEKEEDVEEDLVSENGDNDGQFSEPEDDDGEDNEDELMESDVDEDNGDSFDDEEENNTDMDDEEDGTEPSEDDDFEEDEPAPKRKKRMTSSDINQGKTLFIRNIPFDAEDEDVGEKLEKFGEIVYVRLVMDNKTGHPRGTGFVQFKTAEQAEMCLDASNEEDCPDFTMSGRRIHLQLAVSRDQAVEIAKNKTTKVAKDSRNLYLARIGLIRPGTAEASDLSKLDLQKRMKVEAVKRAKLRDPAVFVSTTRLCVHNLPPTVDERALRSLFQKAAGANVTECRIMRDMGRVNSSGVGKSRGYAFVAFKEHSQALAALNKTNNNAELFGPNKRLIVEFSLENRTKLQARQKRLDRNKVKHNRKQPRLSRVGNEEKPAESLLRRLNKPTGESVIERAKRPKGLPTHFGPKVRHKSRDTKKQRKPPSADKLPSANQPKVKNADKKKRRKRPQRHDVSDDFDKLVNKYKASITKSQRQQQQRATWCAGNS